MYQLKNYMLSLQSNWFINQALYEACMDAVPVINKFRVSEGMCDLPKTGVNKLCTEIYPQIYKFPLFKKTWCKMLVEEIADMAKEVGFDPNPDEDEARQIPEIVLAEKCPELFERMWFTVETILKPVIFSCYHKYAHDIATIQIANYNPKDKQKGAWHHDESADVSIVVPLNTGGYVGGGTEFMHRGIVKPLPSGHALMFPSASSMHRGLAVESGERYLMVLWLFDKSMTISRAEDLVDHARV